ncbi:MAG TPA: hypothetical protein ENG87_00455 [Candidatus Pacearchaeota archaeon]|nr:hypothetical protein [Candidatus Pacearchaeota archaeon]
MNKKGQTVIVFFMIGLVVAILALALAPAVKQSTDTARNQSTNNSVGLDCSNDSISNFNKAACVATDITLPYFIGFLLLFAGAIVVGRIIFQQ